MHELRVRRISDRIAQRNLDAILITDLPNVFYLTGFTGSTAAAVVAEGKSYLLVDPRYTVQARGECESSNVIEYSGKSTMSAAADLINDLKPRRIAYEADNLTILSYRHLRSKVDRGVSLRSTSGMVDPLRRVKDSSEIDLIRRAAGIADATFKAIAHGVQAGMSEKEVALFIDSTMRRLGADREAFDTIAASGPNSACPHASPTDRRIQSGDNLKMDYGARYQMYNSDITRTVCIGKPSDRQRDIYQIVLDAQLRAIDAIAPGKAGREIDAVARDYIASKGFGDNFGHGLGHGLGILVHDGPAFSKMSDIILEPGMVVTVEPGIYIENWGGVRIEDDVLVTEDGGEILTHATKELLSL